MQKIKDNQINILFVALILLSTFAFYWFITRPEQILKKQELEKENYLKLSMQCKKDGEKKLEEDKALATSEKQSPDVEDCFYEDPKYFFNKELNTCLYYGGYTCDLKKKNPEGLFKGDSAKRWSQHIVDVYTNTTLTEAYVEDSSSVPDWKMKEIEKMGEEATRLGF
jgi:hypothetical protein